MTIIVSRFRVYFSRELLHHIKLTLECLVNCRSILVKAVQDGEVVSSSWLSTICRCAVSVSVTAESLIWNIKLFLYLLQHYMESCYETNLLFSACQMQVCENTIHSLVKMQWTNQSHSSSLHIIPLKSELLPFVPHNDKGHLHQWSLFRCLHSLSGLNALCRTGKKLTSGCCESAGFHFRLNKLISFVFNWSCSTQLLWG